MSLIAAAPASIAARATGAENVSTRTGTPASAASRSTAGISRAASSAGSTGGPLRAATAPTSSRWNPASTRASPSATAWSGVPDRAPAKNESSVTLTIPAASGGGKRSVRSTEPPTPRLRHAATVPAVPLRAVYTDLDGTLLGRYGSLFADAEGQFTLRPARGLEACHRAGVEVVIMSGRRESTVASDARLMGQRSYIYEAGCAVVIDGERTYLTGEWVPDEDGTPAQKLIDAGIPQLLFDHFDGPARMAHAVARRAASSRC